jgi:hypothetical protein
MASSVGGASFSFAGEVDELLFVGWINFIRRDGYNDGSTLLQAFRGLHGAAFIPEKQHNGSRNEDDAEEHSFGGITDTLEYRLAGDFCEVVRHGFVG